jgi:hypothetical protein
MKKSLFKDKWSFKFERFYRLLLMLTDKQDKIYYIRVSGMAEVDHKNIYNKLGIKVDKNMGKYFIAKGCSTLIFTV